MSAHKKLSAAPDEARTASLLELTASLGQALTPRQVAAVVLEQGLTTLGGAFGALVRIPEPEQPRATTELTALPDSSTQQASLEVLATIGEAATARRFVATLQSAHPIADAVLTGAEIHLEGTAPLLQRYPAFHALVEEEGLRSLTALPLCIEGRTLGAIALGFSRGRPLVIAERDYLHALSQLCAQALERARLFESERSARQSAEHATLRISRLQELSAACAGALTPQDVAAALLTHGRAALNATAGVAVLVDSQRQRLELAGAQGVPLALTARLRHLAMSADHPLAEAARRRTSLWLGLAAAAQAQHPALADHRARGEQAWAALPLLQGGAQPGAGAAIGAVLFGFETPRAFTHSERTFAETIAHQAAQTLERIRLTTERARLAEAAAGRGEFLASASASFAASLDVETTLARLAQITVPALADFCIVEARVDSGSTQRTNAHLHPAKQAILDELGRCEGTGPSAAFGLSPVFHSEVSAFTPQVEAAELSRWARTPHEASLLEVLGPRSVVTVPVRVRGRLLAVLACVHADSGRQHTREDVALAEDLAQRAGLALDNGLLYQEAQKAVRVREEFLSLAAHELRTPLTALTLTLRSLEREGPEADPRIPRANRHVQRLTRLVESLLDLSTLENHPLHLHRETVDLVALVREVVGRHGGDVTESGCSLTLEAPHALVGHVDRERLEQVVSHLLGNALKFSAGHPIAIVLERVEAAGVPLTARLVVRDAGVGIAPEDQQRVFGRFERAASSEHYGGLGMGLWFARQVLEAHGGRISLESRAGGGTTFTAELPLSTRPSPGDA